MIVLRPSSAHRWTECSLSERFVREPGALLETNNDPAREGTCAAWVAEVVINGDATCCDDLVGKNHENGWFVDQGMADLVQGYVDLVMGRTAPRAELNMSVEISQDVTLAGTADGVSTNDGVLYIDDLKYGYGIVEVDWNRQLLMYMYLYMTVIGWDGPIQLGVYQPRAIHPDGIYRTWLITDPKKKAAMVQAYLNRFMLTKTAVPGLHCDNCLAANGCAALTHTVYSLWEVINGTMTFDADGPAISEELAFLDNAMAMIKSRHAAVQADVEGRLARNSFVPGWAMIDKFGNRKFKLDRDSIHALTGVDPVEEKLITPAALGRLGVDKEVINALSERPFIGQKLSRVDENTISKVFNN